MNPVTATTPKGSPVGTAKGIVHLLDYTYADRLTPTANVVVVKVIGLCRSVLRGKPVERPNSEPTCQDCIDERDSRAAQQAGFEHNVYARRVPLGHSPVAGNNAMRYGSEVVCASHPKANGRPSVVWSKNESGHLREAEKIARQHYVEAYRESLAAKAVPEPVTAIEPARLVELRTEGQAKASQFVDPHVLHNMTAVLAKRGETWAAAILGRDISRRSLAIPAMPWLRNGEEYTLVAADVEEDKARFDQIIGSETGD
jgi:hypothetical protein